jgi:hypothetical protein
MPEIVGQKMSEYTSVDTLAQAKKDAFLASASVTVFGTDPDDANSTVNYNVPLSEITPSPTASSLAGDGLEVSDGKLAVINKVPAPGTETNRGKVLTVNSSDEVVWDTPATELPSTAGLEQDKAYVLQCKNGTISWAAAAST